LGTAVFEALVLPGDAPVANAGADGAASTLSDPGNPAAPLTAPRNSSDVDKKPCIVWNSYSLNASILWLATGGGPDPKTYFSSSSENWVSPNAFRKFMAEEW
jgi:hypothetical protein